MARRTLVVTLNQVRAARLRLKLDARLGRESSRAVKAIANARPLRRKELSDNSA